MNDLIPTDPVLHDLCKVDSLELDYNKNNEETMTTEDLKRLVVEQHGSLSSEDLALLAQGSPDTLVGVKYGIGPRDLYRAADAARLIEAALAQEDQYVREVFITANECDAIRAAFHWPNPYSL